MSRIPRDSQAEAISPIHRIFHMSQSEIVRLGGRIGTGAEGEVYEIQDRDDLVAKVYHEPPPPERAEKLVVLSRLGNERLFNLSAWPVSTLRDSPDGEVVGFVMKKISQAEEVHALHSPKSRLQKFPEASWAFLIYVAANVARAVATIHEHGLVIGDLNPKNILVTRKATVYLLDVDSFQVSVDGKTYRCEGGFPEYTPPELQGVFFRGVDRAQEHDCFGLAAVIFQLLFMGRHPFSGRYLDAGEMPLERAISEHRFAYGADAEARKMRQPPGTLALDSMPPPLVDLFRRAFLSADRPRAREWIEHLDALAKALIKCDLHSGHYYYRELRDCPWCEIESQAGVRLFNFLFSGDESRRGHFRLDEIWKEITSVEAPHIPQIQLDKISKPSPEVAAFAKARKIRLYIALICSAFAGLAITLLVEGPQILFLLSLVGFITNAIVGTKSSSLENIQARKRLAKEEAQRLQEQYDRKSGNERWGAKLDELRNQKETYENLAQIRQTRLQQLEPEARKYQLEEFLGQFKINDAEIRRIVPSAKKVLLSHGIETAADVGEINKINTLMRIPSIGGWLAGWLVEWRRDLEQRFVFNPGGGVPPEARVRVEREVDALRLRLESELSGGARRLRRMKQEIDARGRMLQPALAQACRELAQAQKDLAVAGKHGSTAPILAALIISFIIGLAIKANFPPLHTSGPIHVTVREAASDWESEEKASRLYSEGAQLSLEQRFEKAVVAFQEVVRIDPKRGDAYEKLGYALYRMKRYEESLEASEKAIRLSENFGPYYNSGLAYMELGRWDRAKMAFESAVTHIRYSWEERYTLAYYYLGRSKARLGEATQSIELLEAILKGDPGLNVKRLELASLYLWVGKREAASAQYKIIKDSNPALAEELLKLIKKRGKPA
jgi:DNA-binding helix-hairpin-helix protein with protein kinase domain/Tfp pilus assembly protein PilF